MPQVKESIINKLIKRALKEAESSFGPDNTKFKIGVDVGNPQSETKLGLRIKLKPTEGFLDPDKRGELEAAIMKKMNNSLEQFNIQVSKDTDVPDPEVMGFFIPIEQIKNMIVTSLGGSSEDKNDEIKPPTNSFKPRPTSPKSPKGDVDDLPPNDKGLDELKKIIKNLIKEQSKPKNKTKQELIAQAKEFENANQKDYQKVIDKYVAQGGRPEDTVQYRMPWLFFIDKMILPMDWFHQQPDMGGAVEEKKSLNEMRVRDLNEASKIVIKEDFYNFINAGNNIIRTFEENGKTVNEAKKYIKYLVAHNIM